MLDLQLSEFALVYLLWCNNGRYNGQRRLFDHIVLPGTRPLHCQQGSARQLLSGWLQRNMDRIWRNRRHQRRRSVCSVLLICHVLLFSENDQQRTLVFSWSCILNTFWLVVIVYFSFSKSTVLITELTVRYSWLL